MMPLSQTTDDIEQIRSLIDELESRIEQFPDQYRRQVAPALGQLHEQLESLASAQHDPAASHTNGELDLLRAIFDSAPEGMVVTDEQARIIMINSAAERLYARPVPVGREYSSHTELQIHYPNGKPYDPRRLPLTISALDGETCTDVEMDVVWPDGQRRPLLVNTAPVIDARGKRVGAVGVFQDITQRKQLEQALRESEARLRLMGDTIPYGVWLCDAEGRFIYTSQSYLDLLQMTLDEIRDNQWERRLRPEEAEPTIERWMEHVQSGDDWESEDHILGPDGRYHTVLTRGKPVRDEAGHIICWVGINLDIDDRKRMENALRESESHLRSVMNALFAFVGVLDPSGVLLEANNAPLVAAGIRLEDVAGKLFHDTYWWSHDALVQETIRSAVERAAQGVSSRFDVTAQMAAGRLMYLDFMITPMRDADGTITHLVPSAVDITRRVTYENALRESEERYRQLVELHPDLVFVQSGGRFVFINQAGARILGAGSPEEILGRDLFDFIHPDDIEIVRERIRRLNMDRGAAPREERFLRLDGSAFYVDVVAVPMVYNSAPSALVIARDITQQKELQHEHLVAATEIEIQRRLSGYREMERQEIARDLHDGPIQTLVSALFNVQIARDVVQDHTAQIEFAQISLTMKNVVRELREVVNELRPPSLIRFGLAKALNVYVEDFYEKHPELKVILDMNDEEGVRLPEQTSLALFRICQEALNNIVRHSQANTVWFRFSPQPGHHLLEIEDNGMGFILPEDLVEQTQTGHYGLAGMRERALAVGGKLWITTQPGAGTTIKVSVPHTAHPFSENSP